jgi:drug/metabolite transporter (DMT)-like permease
MSPGEWFLVGTLFWWLFIGLYWFRFLWWVVYSRMALRGMQRAGARPSVFWGFLKGAGMTVVSYIVVQFVGLHFGLALAAVLLGLAVLYMAASVAMVLVTQGPMLLTLFGFFGEERRSQAQALVDAMAGLPAEDG